MFLTEFFFFSTLIWHYLNSSKAKVLLMNFICHSDLSQICDKRLEKKRLRKEEEIEKKRKGKERGALI